MPFQECMTIIIIIRNCLVLLCEQECKASNNNYGGTARSMSWEVVICKYDACKSLLPRSHDSCESPERFMTMAVFFSLNGIALCGEVKGIKGPF